jgi:penicillin-binding protein 1A
MTVRVGNRAGFENVAQFAARAGLPEIPMSAQSYIGNFGATPKDVTMAYTVLANGGVRRQGYLIERIDSASGEIIFRAAHNTLAAIDKGPCATTTRIMGEILERGTAASAKSLGWTKPAAGKTGTTNDYQDAWFVGYTSSLTCGVWVGLDKPATIIPKGYGAALALPVWVDVMKRASSDKYPSVSLKGGDHSSAPVVKGDGVAHDEGGLRKPEKQSGGVLRSFRKFFGGE